MNVASLILWLSNFHTARFSEDSGWYLFYSLVVIFAVVVWGGKLCLPIPPSGLEVCMPFFISFFISPLLPGVSIHMQVCTYSCVYVKYHYGSESQSYTKAQRGVTPSSYSYYPVPTSPSLHPFSHTLWVTISAVSGSLPMFFYTDRQLNVYFILITLML